MRRLQNIFTFLRYISSLLVLLFMSIGSFAQASVSINLAHNTWALISIPASNLAGNSPATVFGDALQPESYGSAGTWAIFSYNPQSNAYTVVPSNANMVAGEGYWMIQTTGADVAINLATNSQPFNVIASAVCPNQSGCVEVSLPNNAATRRWGLMGYPQTNPQSLANTRVHTVSGTCSSSTGCTPDQADQAGVLKNEFYRYDGRDYQSITSVDDLAPGEGFWVSRPPSSSNQTAQWLVPVIDSVKVAFTADQSTEQSAINVLKLIAREETDLLLLQGDYGYSTDKANLWESQLSQHLGVNFPVLSVVGNHENFEWPIYKSHITNRVNRVPDLQCEGDLGEKATCHFRGLHIAQVAVGVDEVPGVREQDGYPAYIQNTLSNSPSLWRICSWHKNQRLMQTGNKANDAGWGVYEACLNAGAIVATGHEHAYSRTHLMSDFQTQTVKHTNSTLQIKPGQSFAFVSGLGGKSVRPEEREGSWWASIYTKTQNATHGALFCTFSGLTADCYFKGINGAIPDSFSLESEVVPPAQ